MSHPRVFVIHESTRIDNATGAIVGDKDLSPAKAFGRLVSVIPPGRATSDPRGRETSNPHQILDMIEVALEDITEDDYLLLTGYPEYIAIAGAVAAMNLDGRLRMLKWDRLVRVYVPIEITLDMGRTTHDPERIGEHKMNDVTEDLSDVDIISGPTDAQRRTIVELCRQQVRQERLVARLEEELHIAKDKLRMISEGELPDAMIDAGINYEGLANGASVELKISYHPKQLTSPEGLTYLDKRGAGSLIKHDINMQFGREQDRLVMQILSRITKWKSASNFKLTEKRAVNAQTLGAYVREQIAAGVDLQLDTLGVYVRRYTEVTLPELTARPGAVENSG